MAGRRVGGGVRIGSCLVISALIRTENYTAFNIFHDFYREVKPLNFTNGIHVKWTSGRDNTGERVKRCLKRTTAAMINDLAKFSTSHEQKLGIFYPRRKLSGSGGERKEKRRRRCERIFVFFFS